MKELIQINPIAALISISCCAGVVYLLFLPCTTLSKSGRLGCLDGLRGFLALGVFVHHYVMYYYFFLNGRWGSGSPNSDFYWLVGPLCVNVFFAITGFLFWNKLLIGQGKINWVSLYISRVFRIFPLYWFSVLIVVFIILIVGGISIKVPAMSLLEQISKWLFQFNIVDLNKFKGSWHVSAGVPWTLKYEWIFYFSLPVFAVIIRYLKRELVFLCLCAGGLILSLAKPVDIHYLLISSRYFIYFIIGAVAAMFYCNDCLREMAQKKIISFVSLGSIVVVFLFYQKMHSPWQTLFFSMFFIPIALGNSILGLLKLPVFILLGEISYSVYLLHGIILYLFFSSFFYLFSNQTGNFLWVNAGMSLAGIIVVMVSWLTYSLIEKPCIDFGKRLSKRFFYL